VAGLFYLIQINCLNLHSLIQMRKKRITFQFILLYPFSLLYLAVTGVRNLLFEWGILESVEFNLPIISVGNITVGGTGKTPHVEYLARLLEKEYTLACLSRGYKRKTRHFTVATRDSSVSEIGDEARQLSLKFPGMTVAVDRRRVHGIRQLMKLDNHIDVILLDDAFQHRYVNPGRSILLIDYNRLITEDFLLPAGRLREAASSSKRADIILVTKSPTRLKPIEMRTIVKKLDIDLRQHLFFTTVRYGNILPVFDLPEPRDVNWFKQQKVSVLLVTGIANPRQVRTFARKISTKFSEINFPDHHAYRPKDISKIEQKFRETGDSGETLILTTEKDAMRLRDINIPGALRSQLYYVPIEIDFLNDDREAFDKIILNYVRNNQRNNILYKEAN